MQALISKKFRLSVFIFFAITKQKTFCDFGEANIPAENVDSISVLWRP
jgi:hypothetical protein